MSDTEALKQTTFSTEIDDGDGYQRLSRFAIWSIPLGLLSALALVSPLLWFVPVLAIVFALVGLRVIAGSQETTGRTLALLGLGLAVLFGTWGVSWTTARRARLNRQAREYATEWLSLMQQEQYMEAHQLSLDFYSRLPQGSSLAAHYAPDESDSPDSPDSPESPESPEPGEPPEPSELPQPNMELAPGIESTPFRELAVFKVNNLPRVLVEAEGNFEFEFVKNVSTERHGQFETQIVQMYRLSFSGDHDPPEIEVLVTMKRTVDGQKAHWQIALNDPNFIVK